MTPDEKLRAVVDAPVGPAPRFADTRVIAREGWFQLVTPSAPGTLYNEVLVSRVAADDAERTIDEVLATYAAIDRPAKWCVGPWTEPEDFGERLALRGFSSWATRGMGCETSAPIATDAGRADVQRVETDDDLDAYVTTSLEGWSMPAEHATTVREAFALAMNEGFLALFTASLDGACVGTGGTLLREGVGYLVGSQVLEATRGRGVYRALVAARLEHLRELGISYAVTHAREATSAPILEHLGFETLFRGRCYLLEPRIVPRAPPPSSAALLRTQSTESDFWAGLFLDLTVRVEWLGQALEAVPKADASVGALARLRSYAHAVEELRAALAHVQEHRRNPRLKAIFSLEGPLAGFLSRLYGWCEEIGNDFERMAVALRRRQPTSTVFSHRAVNQSYAQFDALIGAMRGGVEVGRELHGGGDDAWLWQSLEERVEELIWATEWVHMTLARRPGDD